MTTGVLLMAYGTPGTLAEVEPYLRDIRGGREPTPEAVERLAARYRRIGGRSPLLEITQAQAAKVQRDLGDGFVVRVAMKHWQPRIAAAVGDLGGVDRLVGIVAAPHYSRISIGGYEDRLRKAAADAGAGFDVRMVHHWFEQPAFVSFAQASLRDTLAGWDARDPATRIVFTAHSLPERILAEGDPYLDQLLGSSALVAGGLPHDFAFQSASATGEPWLGPDLRSTISRYADEGARRVVVHPIGFTADHLEILFDIDVEAAEHASSLGIELRRVASPNDDERLARALADAVLEVTR